MSIFNKGGARVVQARAQWPPCFNCKYELVRHLGLLWEIRGGHWIPPPPPYACKDGEISARHRGELRGDRRNHSRPDDLASSERVILMLESSFSIRSR
jgi:hypothetical protein